MDLDALRRRTDPLADGTLAALVATLGLEAANKALAGVVLAPGPLPALPPPLARYFAASGTLPAWANTEQLAIGAEVFATHGPLLLVALICASLPECYTMRNGVQVLALTHRMDERHAYRRIYETAQFVVDGLRSDGLVPGGPGIRAAQKVRLMHAGIRHLLLTEPPAGGDATSRHFTDVLLNTRWDAATLGQPINQEDEVFTLLTFSLVALRALDAWGVHLTPREREGWMHRWAVIGHLMGIEDHLIPRSEAEAATLFAAIQAHQAGPTPQARELTRALTVFFGQVVDSPWLGRHLGPMTIRTLIPAATADLLDVPRLSEGERLVNDLLRSIVRLVSRSGDPPLRRFIATRLVRSLTRLPRQWQRGLFQIPTELSASWAKT